MDVRLIIYDGKIEELRLDTTRSERAKATDLLRAALRKTSAAGRKGLSPECIPHVEKLLDKVLAAIGVNV